MSKRKSIFPVYLAGIAAAMSGCSGASVQPKPNIVLILADDMGYSDIGCFGSEINTPNLDRLAQQGIRMTQFYNASRSCPSRASLLTGLYQHEAGVGDMVSDLGIPSYQGYLNRQCVTLAEVLKTNGYNTYMSGKWHVGNRPEVLPLERGFDRYFGLIDGAGSYFQRIAYRINEQPPRWMLGHEDFNPPDSGFYMTDAITDYAISFLKEEPANNNPFFLYLAYTAPHWPLHAPSEDIEKYRGKYMKGWDLLRQERYQRMLKLEIIDPSVRLTPRDDMSAEWNSLPEEEKKMWDLRMAVYAAMVDRLDQNIGRIVNYLTDKDKLKNTLLIFLSDNGGCHEGTKNKGNYIRPGGETGNPDSFDAYEYPWANASNTPFRMFKHWVHEGGISTPFIAYFPGRIKAGRIADQPGHIIDIMPTLLDISGGTYPETFKGNEIVPMEGVSLVPLFNGMKLKRKEPLFWEHEGNRAVRSGDWKLVSAYDYQAKNYRDWELYNMKSDRSELTDLKDTYPGKIKELVENYEKWSERVGVLNRKKQIGSK